MKTNGSEIVLHPSQTFANLLKLADSTSRDGDLLLEADKSPQAGACTVLVRHAGRALKAVLSRTF